MIGKHTRFQLVATTVLLLALGLAFAALPPGFNYQGHLTDSSGAPVDGSVNITFRIYNTQTDITPLWTDSQVVTVNQGVFSVELGDFTSNPFPPGLFDQPLWIGLSVGSDAEMTPRRPLTSIGYAFKADDANTLSGIHASTLDQSAHVTDTANPHNVTPSQIGAADATMLDLHLYDTGNPHGITASQVGAPTSTEFGSHVTSFAPHHPRYTDGEAVTAMGTKKDSNALNHDKYSNSNAVAAMLAADGAGSTLDADLVDGLQASELIDAAQDEVRMPISSLPYTINQSGSYFLTGNLDGSSGGINITTDDVTLDLMGFTIDGGGSIDDYGIDLQGRNNVTIRDGTVKSFGRGGIYQGNFTGLYAKAIDIQALENGKLGFSDIHSGIYLYDNSHIENCIAGSNGGSGIVASTSSILINNTAYNNSGPYGIYGGSGSTIKGNTARGNTGTYGIYGHTGSVLTGNTAYFNTVCGIYGGIGSSLTGNTAYYNSGTTSYGIYAYYGATVKDNTVYLNESWGIFGARDNLIKDNNVHKNNSLNTAGLGGLRVGNDSQVTGNMLDNNGVSNIVVKYSGSVLRQNHLTDSGNGIIFSADGNFYQNNTGSGNTTAFINLNGTTQTDGGGNVSF